MIAAQLVFGSTNTAEVMPPAATFYGRRARRVGFVRPEPFDGPAGDRSEIENTRGTESLQTCRCREKYFQLPFPRAMRLRFRDFAWQLQIIERRRHAAEAGDYRLRPPLHGARNRKFESSFLHRRV